jgi:hypothetical protein
MKKLIADFEVLTAVKMSVLVFWVVMPCGLVGKYCLHLQVVYFKTSTCSDLSILDRSVLIGRSLSRAHSEYISDFLTKKL